MGSCSYFGSKTFLQLLRKWRVLGEAFLRTGQNFHSLTICFCFNRKFVLLREVASSVSSYCSDGRAQLKWPSGIERLSLEL